ncbi:uncharacterized protein LOC113149646 [Anabas testudineus]|uniref:uncharacterized protein LOC113149646 n=1 Tax=Anabas testudineus TaxID=64144 RepID=UPI000E46366E|nr:uncharacterized protein LOC113149646 [Anabas testudineus]
MPQWSHQVNAALIFKKKPLQTYFSRERENKKRQRRRMAQFRWIQMSLFLILMLQFTVTGQYSKVTVRDGDDVTLPCGNVTDDQNKCNSTTWTFSVLGNSTTVTLFEHGQIHNSVVKSKSDRLSVTENCSLVIKKVTDEDVGLYTCRQFISGRQQGGDSVSVVTIICADCDIKTVPSSSFPADFKHQTQQTTTTTTTTTTATASSAQTNKTDSPRGAPGSWWFILVAVAAVALLISVVGLMRRKKTKKESESYLYENMELRSYPKVTENQNMTEPHEDVSFASISYKDKSKQKSWDYANDYGNVGAVIYNNIEDPTSPDDASCEPIYANIN